MLSLRLPCALFRLLLLLLMMVMILIDNSNFFAIWTFILVIIFLEFVANTLTLQRVCFGVVIVVLFVGIVTFLLAERVGIIKIDAIIVSVGVASVVKCIFVRNMFSWWRLQNRVIIPGCRF